MPVVVVPVPNSYRKLGGIYQMIEHFKLDLGTDHLTWKGGYGFVSFRNFFSDNTRVRKKKIPEFSIWLYDKNSESDYFFFLHQNQNIFFQQHWESEYFFRKFFF